MTKFILYHLTGMGMALLVAMNALAQCPTTPPSGTGACRIGPGSVTLSASGSSGFYSWYDPTGTTFLGNGSTLNTPYITSTADFLVAAAATNSSLIFDGTDEYVLIGNQAALQITGDLTIEMWVKPTDFSARRNLYAKAYGGEGTITQETSGTLTFYYGTSGVNTTPYQEVSSITALELNTWNHIAIVRDLTNGRLYWYINGEQTNSVAASYTSATAGTNPVYIARGYVSNFAGQIDELRVWNTARSQTDIQNNMYQCLTGSEVGLAAYWAFDDNGGTTLTDSGPNGLHGVLTNMETTDWLTDTPDKSCPSCESSRTAVTATIAAGTPVDLGPDRCFDVSETLDAGAGYSSYLWQDGSTGQTFTATVSGTYYVTVSDAGGCTDQDTVRLQINPPSPSGTGACRFGTGPVTLTASGSSGNYNWYDAPTGGNYLGNGASFTTPPISATTDFYVAALNVNYSLDFDGTDDYVDLGNPAELQITGDLTIEMWLRPTDFSARRNPYAKAYGGEGTITQETDGTLTFYYGTAGTDAFPYQGFGTAIPLELNTWNHVALVRDLTNGQLYWYINGVLTNTATATYAAAAKSSLAARIGAGYVSNYAGQIGELRIWKVARTATDIQANLNGCCDCINNTDLVGYWDFDDGPGSTMLTDLSASENHGTLVNMDPAADWLNDAPAYSCESCESPRIAVTATVSSTAPVDLGADDRLVCSSSRILDAGTGYSSYLWQDGSTAQTYTVNAGGTYWVEVSDAAGCVDQDTIRLIDPGSSSTALEFDGVNDQVNLGNPAELRIAGDMTVEMWLRPASFAGRMNPFAKAYGGEGAITQETNGLLNYYYGTSGGNASPYEQLTSGTALVLNEWQHIAIVRDLTNGQVTWYINGVPSGSRTTTLTAVQTGGSNAYIGTGYAGYYAGRIDEVRIWNTARTQTEIRDNMAVRLLGTESGLVAYYRMDDGSGTTLTDATLNSLDGTLVNMDPATDWVISGTPVGDYATHLFTASWGGQSLSLSPCGQDVATVNNVSGNPAGVLLYYVGTVPNDITGINGLGNNDRYFGVHKLNDNTATYTFTYNYLNNPHVNFADEANLALFFRTDNAAGPWSDAGATIDLGANTLTATGQSTEFILGSNGLPLPVVLTGFSARPQRDHVLLSWETRSEINNDFFTLERATDPERFTEIDRIPGAGWSYETVHYTYKDFGAPDGKVYYRLSQTDFDGTTEYFGIVMIENRHTESPRVAVYPNPPAEGIVRIYGTGFSRHTSLTLQLTGTNGKVIFTRHTHTDEYGRFTFEWPGAASLPAGIYLVRAAGQAGNAYARIAIE